MVVAAHGVLSVTMLSPTGGKRCRRNIRRNLRRCKLELLGVFPGPRQSSPLTSSDWSNRKNGKKGKTLKLPRDRRIQLLPKTLSDHLLCSTARLLCNWLGPGYWSTAEGWAPLGRSGLYSTWVVSNQSEASPAILFTKCFLFYVHFTNQI